MARTHDCLWTILHSSLVDGCRQMLRAKRSQFLQADWFSRCGGTCRTTHEIDELNVAYNKKGGVTPIVLYLRHAQLSGISASTGWSEELLKRRRRTEVSVFLQLAAMVPIGRHAFKYRRWFVPLVPSAPELCISVHQWPERLGHRAH